ncbi:DNA repair protein RadA [Natranaerobius trueperi]|uniref:DNA repair protein RadA n=1 Tax=Natranaerobius trueperi TaxID=759412 RepID=A0A226BZN8_9FIRM|nr:DNA repair protein RadA [Natranaerobius trueperi]OWZ84518.1 DNA repair protein RadA [Natranaerobius trueperi]
MKKAKIHYICNECGHVDLKWLGKCPECDNWNTFLKKEETSPKSNTQRSHSNNSPQVVSLSGVPFNAEIRISSKIAEFDRVLGGGVVPGSVVLVGGSPGIGKSTLMLQVANNLFENKKSVVYVSGEESLSQVKIRCDRLELNTDMQFASGTNLQELINELKSIQPEILIIDSIQSLYHPDIQSTPGSLTQVRECALYLQSFAKENNTACFIVGHVTKDGNIAGPKVLEHIVDTVLHFEGDKHHSYRIIRGLKNRFGANELGVFEMQYKGLVEVNNPSEIFLRERPKSSFGSTILPSLEGTRTFLVEIQALVGDSHLGTPRRVVTGIDNQRVALITAVLEKKGGLNLVGQDIFVNAVGGVKISEPAADLAIAMTLVSSFKEKKLPEDLIVLGELGLTGEVRSCNQIEARLKEAERMGFRKALIPYTDINSNTVENLELYLVRHLTEAFNFIFEDGEIGDTFI